MTAEAKTIYEALLKHGPLDTIRLRREARMSAESAKSRFERGLVYKLKESNNLNLFRPVT